MKFFEWQLVRCRACCKQIGLGSDELTPKNFIGCGVTTKLLVCMGLVSFELATVFPVHLVAPSKLVYRFKTCC